MSTELASDVTVMTPAGPMPARYAALPHIPFTSYLAHDDAYVRDDFDIDVYNRIIDAINSIPTVDEGFLEIFEPDDFGVEFRVDGKEWLRPKTDDELYAIEINPIFDRFDIDGRGDIHQQLIERLRGIVDQIEHGILMVEAAKVSFDWLQAHPEAGDDEGGAE